jgi:putative iron-regulated protein
MKKSNIKQLFITLVSGSLIAFSSCKKNEDAIPDKATTKTEAIETYSNIVYASYSDSYDKANDLLSKINTFAATPTQTNFDACKQAWKDSRIPYGQTEAYRFYDGAIDGQDGLEGFINSWPLDESYIDYVNGDNTAGIINKPASYPNITKQVLMNLNTADSETNVATGYHAIEFLLWGQDFYDNSAGKRPYTDFVTGADGTAANQDRRRMYLKVVTELLVEHLATVRDAWKPNSENFRKSFTVTSNQDVAIAKLLSGVAILCKGELAGQRMSVALVNQDQEEEHSCFSDNTHIDIQMNFKGIKNVYLGTYTRTDGSVVKGKGFSDLVALYDVNKNNAVLMELTETEAKIMAIPAPFDQAIKNDVANRNIINNSIIKLRSLSDKIVDTGTALGIQISGE